MTRPFRVVISAGGTGGHVFPALALADHLTQLQPSGELLFVGSRGGLEQQLVPARGYRLALLRVAKLRGMGLSGRLRAVGSLPLATAQAVALLRRFAPRVVVGLGGYASAPVVLAAMVVRCPVVLLEQNAIPGTTNRLLARLATAVVIAFRRAARYLPADRTLLLGNPVRPELLAEVGERLPWPPTLLVLGGSQGARAVNQLVTEAAPRLVQRVAGLRIHHQTGPADAAWVEQRYRDAGIEARVEPFIEQMGPAYREATLVVGRSGATTLAELCVAGLPALLIPYPYAADDHQAANAAELVEAGGAVMCRQASLDPERLAGVLGDLLSDRERLGQMAQAMRASAHPEAGRAIAALLLDRFG